MSIESDSRNFNPVTILPNEVSCRADGETAAKVTVVPTSASNPEDEFIERQYLKISPLEYSRHGKNPGLVLIFNQEHFENSDPRRTRRGTTRDVNEIAACMGRLGYNISEHNHIFNDYSRAQIIQVLDKLSETDLKDCNSLIIFFLTHGWYANQLQTKDGYMKGSDLWDSISRHEDLKGKPKIFIFQILVRLGILVSQFAGSKRLKQMKERMKRYKDFGIRMFMLKACKGGSHSSTAAEATENDTIQLVPELTFKSNYIGPDMLIAYSTSEGNSAFRHSNNGSWFIQELCKNFTAYGRRDDIISLIIRTTKCVSRNYYEIENGELMKQMPVFISTLTKKFYLNRNKDRSLLWYVLAAQEKLKEKVNKLIEERKITNDKQ